VQGAGKYRPAPAGRLPAVQQVRLTGKRGCSRLADPAARDEPWSSYCATMELAQPRASWLENVTGLGASSRESEGAE